MSKICWYFHLHQPWRLRPYHLFEVGNQHDYFATANSLDYANQRVLQKVAAKSYRPMLGLLNDLLARFPNFHWSLSITGVMIEQLQAFAPDVLLLLQQLVATGRVEIIAETYWHSLASLYDQAEFRDQVRQHNDLVKTILGVQPTVFRNTELVYTDAIAEEVAQMGYRGMLAEGADRILNGRPPTRLYRSGGPAALPLLLKHYHLSDDIAFRFSQRSWAGWPLTAEKYTHWLTAPFAADDLINLFMDFETFGEHQWEEHGIFPFFAETIRILHDDLHVPMVTPTQIITAALPTDKPAERPFRESLPVFSSTNPVSWADVDRDITAWVGNPLQHDVLRLVYELSQAVRQSGDKQLETDWRRLQTSDHFYYMCTKWANDGDVHAYFSPYCSPYDAYTNYNNILTDLRWRCGL
jgi:alpha-amylase